MRLCMVWCSMCLVFWLSGGMIGCESRPPQQETSQEVANQQEPSLEAPVPDAAPPERVVQESKPDTPVGKCNPPASLGAGPYFKDISKEVGLGLGALQVFGNRISTADLDGDGYPDLLVHATNGHNRPDFSATPPKRYRWVLMNRPSPDDPSRRVFVDLTKESGYIKLDDGTQGRVSHFAIFGDVNNDGHIDIFSAVYLDPNSPDKMTDDRSRILLGDGKGGFTPLPMDKAGITPPKGSLWTTTSATFLDYDRDGKLDIFVGFWYEKYGVSYEGLQDRLYKGKGDGTFEDVTDKVGLKTLPFANNFRDGTHHRPTYGVTSCDANGDGWPDLLVSAYGRQFNMLYLNRKGSFENVAKETGFDGDNGRQVTDNEFYKCYCAARAGNCPASVPKPRVQCPARPPWNPGYDDHPFRLNGNTFTTVCGDINGDGKMDMFNTEIRHWHIGDSSDTTQLILNTSTPDKFSLQRLLPKDSGIIRPRPAGWNEGDLMAAFFDFDQDGRQDIYLCNSDYPGTHGHLFRQMPSSTQQKPGFRDVAKAAGVDHPRAAGLALADIDADGDLDLIVGSSTARCKASEGCPWTKSEVHVYENLVGAKASWVRIRLKGKGAGGANTFGIGAKITITAGGRSQTQEISGGYGHFGLHNGLFAHFGLGNACQIDKLEVRWPNSEGSTQTFTKLQVLTEILLEEGKETPTYRPLVR